MKKAQRILTFLLCASVFMSVQARAQSKGNTMSQGTYKTIFEMLRDVPGIEIKTSNDKVGGSIIVRGTGSLNNQRPPLFVVDGAIYNGSITNINPQDVDGISVLKDAASTSAYGAQGAGGVIVITTIKGVGPRNNAVVSNYNQSAYTYFIDHKTPLKVIGYNDEVIIEGIISKQKDGSLVFMQKRKETLVPIKNIKKVEMIQQ